MPPVAVVICSRDRPAFLAEAVAALRDCLRPGDEAIVVDSASNDPQACEPARQAGIPVIRAERPGLSLARNTGFAATSAPLIAFTDDDCRPRPDWTAAIDRAFERADTTGFVTGRVVPDIPRSVPVSVALGDETRRFGAADSPFGCGTGANMAFRRLALERTGGFDESLGAGSALRSGEDTDMFWRVLRGGWMGVFDPRLEVVHRQWRTAPQAVRLGYAYGLGGGALAVKAIRVEGRAGWQLLGRRIGRDCLGQLGRDLARRYRSGVAMDVLLTAGTVAGALRAARLDLREGRFGA